MKQLTFLIFTSLLTWGCLNAQIKDPTITEVWYPEARVVTPGQGTSAPSDAIVLFDGTNFNEWQNLDGDEVGWTLEDGAMTVKPKTGDIQTKREFGDMQLHIEWRTPSVVKGEGQGRGNSGVFLQSRYEVQVLDNYENKRDVSQRQKSS